MVLFLIQVRTEGNRRTEALSENTYKSEVPKYCHIAGKEKLCEGGGMCPRVFEKLLGSEGKKLTAGGFRELWKKCVKEEVGSASRCSNR